MIRRLLHPLTLIFVAAASAVAQTVPPRPTNLVAALYSGEGISVRLHWDAPREEDGSFKIYRSLADSQQFQVIGSADDDDREFRDRHVILGRTYEYYVTALSEGRNRTESDPSDTVSITIVTPPKGIVRGTVTDDSTGLPISRVKIKFHRFSDDWNDWDDWEHRPRAYTDSAGQYEALLDTGTYLVKAEPRGCRGHWFDCYQSEWYDNSPEPSGATPVVVGDSSVFTADFGLSKRIRPTFVYVSGTVTDSAGNPLRKASVAIMRTVQEMSKLAAITGESPGMGEESMEIEGLGHSRGVIWRAWTDSLGNFRARVISGKDYIALASKRGYVPQYFDHKSSPTEADIIRVVSDTTGINFSLGVDPDYQNSISGVVRDSLGTVVPSRIILFPVNRRRHEHTARFIHTDSLGAFTINHVRTGNYFVFAIPFSGFAPAFYKANSFGVRRWRDADTVNITGAVTEINIGVVPIVSEGIAHIGGRIRSTNGLPVEGVGILALTSDNTVAGFTMTNGSGQYALDAIAAGNIRIVAVRDGFYESEQSLSIAPTSFSVTGVDLVVTPAFPSGAGETGIVPLLYTLQQNFPNPFNPETRIRFDVPVQGHVTLKVFDVLGRNVRTLFAGIATEGTHNVVWSGLDDEGRQVSSGVYFYRLEAITAGGSVLQVRKMILMK